MDNDKILDIFKCAKEVFGNGIYVPCDMHPCGWDFISFKYIEEDEILDYNFEYYDISRGIYDDHPFDGLTLSEILKETKGKFEFELGHCNW